jgi:hypothetical protein
MIDSVGTRKILKFNDNYTEATLQGTSQQDPPVIMVMKDINDFKDMPASCSVQI